MVDIFKANKYTFLIVVYMEACRIMENFIGLYMVHIYYIHDAYMLFE